MSSKRNITITVNGQQVDTEDQVLIPDFLKSQEMNPERVVVEYNGTAQTRHESATTRLQQGDTLEVVRIVAGG